MDLIQEAAKYIAAGVSVVPVGRDKKPSLSSWKQYQYDKATESEIKRWRGVGLACVCGSVSGGRVVIDFDVEGFYESWLAGVGSLAEDLPLQKTGGGCYQVCFLCDEPGANLKLAWVPDETELSGRSVAIETRGEGGYAVVPGSLHPSGKTYELLKGDWLNPPRLSMDQVRTLLAVATGLDQCPKTRQQKEKEAKAAKIKPRKGASKNIIGQFNDAVTIRSILEKHGYSGSNGKMIRPGGKSASVIIFDDKKSFHHSSNDPLNDGHAHDSFSIFCELEHGGDVTAAVKAAMDRLGIEPDQSRASFSTWEDLGLSLNSNGGAHPNLDNACTILSGHGQFAGRIWWDEFHEKIFSTLNGDPAEWTDADDLRACRFIQKSIGISKMAVATVQGAVAVVARQNVKNEPRQWLEGLKWDGTNRLCNLMFSGFGAEACEYHGRIGECFFVSMVARVLKPGCKVDTMPIFEGHQGAFKSQALGVIGGKWFVECHEQMTSKDFYGVIQGHILLEISELHAFTRSEVERVKGIISCAKDRYRAPYERRAADHYRQCVFAGTTNRDDWNRDETGARRFWPVKCGKINLDWLAASREQLFAEAVSRFKAGDDWWTIPIEEAIERQQERRPEDSWAKYIHEYLETQRFIEYVTSAEILENALKLERGRQDRGSMMRVGVIMRDTGWARRRVRADGSLVWGYFPPDR